MSDACLYPVPCKKEPILYNGRMTEFYSVRQEPFALYGLYDPYGGGVFRRLPASVAEATGSGVAMLSRHTAGGRVRFCTDSTALSIFVRVHEMDAIANMTLILNAGCDVYVKKPDGYRLAGLCCVPIMEDNEAIGRVIADGGYQGTVGLDGSMNDITINLPLYGPVDELYIGVDAGAHIGKAPGYRPFDPVVYYGSSITQGGCASRSGCNYSAILSRKYEVDFRTLGFSGNARGETIMAEYIASLPMSLFVMAYDHNAPDVAHLSATHEPFYRIVRKAHPDMPVIFTTRPKPHYTDEECRRREVVRDTYRHALERGEKVYFLDGEQMFGRFGGEEGNVDGTHPNDLGFACIAAALDPIFHDVFGLPGSGQAES